MARVTVEDCIDKVSNRFELVLLAAQRARDIASGAVVTVDIDNDKNPVIALREVADETVPLDEMREGVIRSLRRSVEVDEPEVEEDGVELLEQELADLARQALAETGGPEAQGEVMPDFATDDVADDDDATVGAPAVLDAAVDAPMDGEPAPSADAESDEERAG